MNNKEITLGENLRLIRKKLKLRQEDITGGKISRNLISTIETNKTPLYENVAKIVSKNINKKVTEKGLDIYVSSEDIMNPYRMQAKEKCDEYIQTLKNQLETKQYQVNDEFIEEVEIFLNDWNLPEKKAQIFELLGDIYYYAGDRENEYTYYVRALDSYFTVPVFMNRHILVLKLMSLCNDTRRYHETIRLSNTLLSNLDMVPSKDLKTLFYNKALGLYGVNKYDECLDTTKLTLNHLEKEDRIYLRRLKMLEGLCYSKLGELDRAIEVYKESLTLLEENHDEICITYINIIEILIIKNDIQNIVKYKDRILELLDKVSEESNYLTRIYYNLGEIFKFLQVNDLAEEYYFKAYENSIVKREKKNTEETLVSMFDFFYSTGNNKKIVSLKYLFKNMLSDILLGDEVSFLLKMIYVYLEEGDIEEAKKLIKETLQGGKK